MIPLAFSASLSLLLALLCGSSAILGRAAAAHLAFAMGAMPLIIGAMQHFILVLTRSDAPAKALRALPWLAQLAGLLAVGAIEGWWPRHLLHLAALLVVLIVLTMLCWMVRRARRCVGSPHPGWRWYAAALVMLLLAMLAVPLIDTRWGWPARLFHLHANLLGLIVLAALGTLPVLLPTVLGRSDPAAAPWLRRWCWPLLAAALLMALGAAWGVLLPVSALLAPVGASLMLCGVASLLWRWAKLFGRELWRDGAAASLLAALLGLLGILLLLGGTALTFAFGHAEAASYLLPGSLAIPGFAIAFLLPLVSGTLSHLLPVWRYPLAMPQRLAWRQQLVAAGRLRAVLWLGAAVLLGFVGFFHDVWLLPWAALAAVIALLNFIFALRPCRSGN